MGDGSDSQINYVQRWDLQIGRWRAEEGDPFLGNLSDWKCFGEPFGTT